MDLTKEEGNLKFGTSPRLRDRGRKVRTENDLDTLISKQSLGLMMLSRDDVNTWNEK